MYDPMLKTSRGETVLSPFVVQLPRLAVASRSVAHEITVGDALVTEVEKMVVGREIRLVGALRRARDGAPDSARAAALAELLSSREARLARFRAASAGSATEVEPGDPDTAAPWGVWADEATVGAALGRAFLQELRTRLGRPVPLLDAAIDSEPVVPDVLRQAAGDRRAVAATTKRVVHEMTDALLASPTVSAHLGREGSLAAFAALFDALPE
jgi:hypothetical protein